jgi:hypothetical protein
LREGNKLGVIEYGEKLFEMVQIAMEELDLIAICRIDCGSLIIVYLDWSGDT